MFAREEPPEFRASLREAMHVGLRWGGGAILLGTAAHVVLSVGIEGKALRWTYPAPGADEITLLSHAIIGVVGIGFAVLSRVQCSLRIGRLAGGIAVLLACGASMHDDLVHRMPVSVEYVILIYMVTVVTVPFRPWQVLGVGGGVLSVYAALTEIDLFLPSAAAKSASFGDAGLGLSLAVGLGTVVSAVLYVTRRAQHRVRREAQKELTTAKERAERALATVEQQAEQLRDIDEMKTRFFANVSHELRTPLSLLAGPLDQLQEHDRPPEEAEMLRTMRRNVERLQRLVEQLLDLARYDVGDLSFSPSQQEWGRFVERETQRFRPMAETQGVSLSVKTPPVRVPVAFDPDHMKTVLSILVRNALSRTPGGGDVAVRAAVENGEACLAVDDTGPGIPAERQERLFDRFYRGAESGGTDQVCIGLILAEALVTLHDGTIGVESTPDEGSVFVVRWPATRPGIGGEPEAAPGERERERGAPEESSPAPPLRNDTASSADPGQEPASSAEDRTTILVVEDNAGVRRFVRRLLERDYHVLEAEHGREGLERARAALPDLVVTDVMMPGMGGFEMIERLRRDARTDHIPVVVLTARAEAADRVEGLSGGAQAYVTKPFDADVLRAQIRSLIETQRRLRDRFRNRRMERAAAASTGTDQPAFADRVRALVASRLSDADLTVEELADELGCARRTLTRKTKEAFDQSPSDLIRAMRLERGATLLHEEEGTVSEVAYAVGFNSLSYFSRCFKKRFGEPPSTYRRN